MTLDRLWAGWRAQYVGLVASEGEAAAASSGGGPEAAGTEAAHGDVDNNGLAGCVFCVIAGSSIPDTERYIVWSGDTTFAILNAYPYTSGHVLVMPIRHVRELGELTADEAVDLWSAVRDAVAAVRRAYRPEGLNLGVNLGRAAGAGIPAHLHVHVVPRWTGDTSFMTATAEVRVLPEALPVTWQRLRDAWREESWAS